MSNIPKQLFVTFQERVEYVYGSKDSSRYKLGFLHPHLPSQKADAKRKKTQMEWAYGHYHKQKEDGSIEIDSYDYTQEKQVVVPVASHLLPVIWDNIPLNGFKVLQSVSRYSTSNKVWRILDPRGVVFEISTASFQDIIMNSTIINGEIIGECVWVGSKTLKLWSNEHE